MLLQRSSHRQHSPRAELQAEAMSETSSADGDDDDKSGLLPPSTARLPPAATATLKPPFLRLSHSQSRVCMRVAAALLVASLAVSLCALLARPLILLHSAHLSSSCRGVDTSRFFLPPSHNRSPVHCPAYRPLDSGGNTTWLHVHFVYGLEAHSLATNFTLLSYLAILSAHRFHQPSVTIHLHHHYRLTGHWFDSLHSQLGASLALHEVDDVQFVFDQPVHHYAHKADIVRLRALQQYGGVYLDADVITVRPLHPLLPYSAVLAEEPIGPGLLNYATTLLVDGYGGAAERLRGVDGLANAVILAHANSPFVASWYARYSSFNSSRWDYHSCKLPLLMASERPPSVASDLLTLSAYAFYHPQYDALAHFFHSADADLSRNFGVHFAHLHRRLGQADFEHNVGGVNSVEEGLERNKDNNFGRVMRAVLHGEALW